MKKQRVQCIKRALRIFLMILAALSLTLVTAFASGGSTMLLDSLNEGGESALAEHTDVKSDDGYKMFLGFNSANMTFGAYEEETFFSVLFASNAKLYETIQYGELQVTAEVDRPVDGKVYRIGYADVLGNTVYFSGEIDGNGALVATDDASFAADVVVISRDGGYILGVVDGGETSYLGLVRDEGGKYAFFLGDLDEIEELNAAELADEELRSSFAYDGEVLEVEFTKFIPDNICDDCGADLPGLSEGEIIAIVAVAASVVILSVVVIVIYRIVRKKSAGYIFDVNGFR